MASTPTAAAAAARRLTKTLMGMALPASRRAVLPARFRRPTATTPSRPTGRLIRGAFRPLQPARPGGVVLFARASAGFDFGDGRTATSEKAAVVRYLADGAVDWHLEIDPRSALQQSTIYGASNTAGEMLAVGRFNRSIRGLSGTHLSFGEQMSVYVWTLSDRAP